MRLIAAAILLVLLTGCGAVSLPEPATEPPLPAEVTLPLVLAIEPAGHDALADELVDVLRDKQLFREVGLAADLGGRADLVGRLRYDEEEYGHQVPIFTIATLGIVPTTYGVRQRVGLVVSRHDRKQARFETTEGGKAIVGWLGWLLLPSPRWRSPSAIDDMRAGERLLAHRLSEEIARRARELHSR